MQVATRFPKSLWSYNPIPRGCVLYLPLWSPSLGGSAFKSVESYGHACSVTGAVLVANGRQFDSSDDLINCGSASSLDNIFDGGGTVGVWINPSSDGGGDSGYICAKIAGTGISPGWFLNVRAEASSYVESRFYFYFSGNDGYWDLDSAAIPIGSWTHIALTYDADSVNNNPVFLLNGAVSPSTEQQAPTTAREDEASVDFTIGGRTDATKTFDGYIGEVWAYNRTLSTSEIAYIYHRTRGRYQ